MNSNKLAPYALHCQGSFIFPFLGFSDLNQPLNRTLNGGVSLGGCLAQPSKLLQIAAQSIRFRVSGLRFRASGLGLRV